MIKPEDREFVVDSGTSTHMLSGKDVNSGKVDTARVSRHPTQVMTAKGEVQTNTEATVYRIGSFLIKIGTFGVNAPKYV